MQYKYFRERQLIDKAIEALHQQFPIEIDWKGFIHNQEKNISGYLTVSGNLFAVAIKHEFRPSQVANIIADKKKHNNYLLIAAYFSEPVRQTLKNENINYLDATGNAFIFVPTALAIAIDGQKKVINPDLSKDKAFTKTGLNVVFEYLKDKNLLYQNYRTIAAKAAVSLDTITKTNQSLKQQGFIRQLTAQTICLQDIERLFYKWSDAYENRLKPKFFYERFSFLSPEAERDWQQLPLSSSACWGGECAAAILTSNLRPAKFTLYTTDNRVDLMKKYRMKPNLQGNIFVYLPFTDLKNIATEKNITHSILTYSDLLNSGDARNYEIAQQIYESDVKILF